MGKRDLRRRREKRRERQATEHEEAALRPATPIPTGNRSFAFEARGVTVSLPIEAQPVQGHGGPLTRDEARARLAERAFGRSYAE